MPKRLRHARQTGTARVLDTTSPGAASGFSHRTLMVTSAAVRQLQHTGGNTIGEESPCVTEVS